MVIMRIKPTGVGTPADPIRCPIPTYSMIADMGPAGWIVQVRDEDVPAGMPAPVQVNVPGFGVLNVITGLSAGQQAAWSSHLDSRYPQRDKSNAPQVV